MKDLQPLVWLIQLFFSVVTPLIGFPLLSLWLQSKYGWGQWTVWAAVALGILSAIDGLRSSLKTLRKFSRSKKQEDIPPPVSFSEHD